jgi:hypothetical protein
LVLRKFAVFAVFAIIAWAMFSHPEFFVVP